MKRLFFATGIATVYVIIFHALPHAALSMNLVMWMFVMSPFIMACLAYVILKYGKPPGYTFDDRFYDDLDYRRNGKEQQDEPA